MTLPSLFSATAVRCRRSLHDVAAVGLLLGATACGTDSTTEPVTSLTPADRLAVAGQVAVPSAVAVGLLSPDLSAAMVHNPSAAASVVAGLPPATGRSAASVAALGVALPIDRTVSCPSGGSTRTTGTLTGSLAAGGSGSLNVVLFTSFAACGVPADGRTLLLTADPGLEAKGLYAVDNRVPADPQTLSITGSVNVSVSGSRGIAIPCAVLLTVTTSASTHVSNITGTVCGAAVSRQLTWSP